MNDLSLFFGAFLGVALFWLGSSAYCLLDRSRSDRLRRRLAGCGEGGAAMQVLTTLPRRTLYRLVCDSAQPCWLKDALATHILARFGARRVLREAAGRGGRWRRIGALHVLYQARARGLHALLRQAVAGADRDVAAAVVVLLGKLQDRAAAAILICALQRNWYAPSRIAMQLDRFPSTIADLLIPLLDDPQPQVRCWAILLLSRHRGLDLLDARLAAHAHDADPDIRKAVVQALGDIGGARAVPVAIALLGDEASYVRAHAARALGKLFSPARAGFGALLAPMLADRDWWVRLAVREALSAMGPVVRRDVAAQLDSNDGFARDGAREVLKQIGMERAGRVIAFPHGGAGPAAGAASLSERQGAPS